jgi:hypothetical protein
MSETNKSRFIVETAVRMYAALRSSPETDPDAKTAISDAIKLWEELEKQEFVTSLPLD